jgi:hypothetical protein
MSTERTTYALNIGLFCIGNQSEGREGCEILIFSPVCIALISSLDSLSTKNKGESIAFPNFHYRMDAIAPSPKEPALQHFSTLKIEKDRNP